MYPAHDYNGNTVSSIGEEKKFNPRLQVKNAEEYANIMNNLNLPNPKMMDVAIPKNLNHGIDYINQKKFNGLTTEEFINLIHKQSSILIDLREKSEIEKFGKIKNSINIPLRQLLDYLHSNETELSDKKILFYCAVGQRSSLAVKIASSYKFNSCFHLIGGLKLWIEKNFYLEE